MFFDGFDRFFIILHHFEHFCKNRKIWKKKKLSFFLRYLPWSSGISHYNLYGKNEFSAKTSIQKKKILKRIFRGLRIFFPTPEFCAEFGFRIRFRWKIRQCALPTRQKERKETNCLRYLPWKIGFLR